MKPQLNVLFRKKIVLLLDLQKSKYNIHNLSYQALYGRLSTWGEKNIEKILSTPPSVKTGYKNKRAEIIDKPVGNAFQGVHPEIINAMKYGTNNDFIRACEKFGR